MRDSLPVNAGRRYFAAADVLRILCIFTVAWFHIWQQSWLDPSFRIAGHYFDLQRIVRRGYMLVDLTLLLTGCSSIPLMHSRSMHRFRTRSMRIFMLHIQRI